MIRKFGSEAVLLMIDVQRGVDDLEYWGGRQGHRNNPQAEERLVSLLEHWRSMGGTVVFTRHDSREAHSPLKVGQPGGEFKPGLEPRAGELVIVKSVNSGFIGTPLELELRRHGISRVVAAGFFTNMCVSTTVRMSGNLGFDTYLARDACACSNRMDPDGGNIDADTVHRVTIANLHGEFCTALASADVERLIADDVGELERRQGNE